MNAASCWHSNNPEAGRFDLTVYLWLAAARFLTDVAPGAPTPSGVVPR